MNIELLSKEIGKKVEKVIEVEADGTDFAINTAIEAKVKELGFNMGSMARDMPRALSKKASYIAKWYNIPSSDYPKIEGLALCDDNRNGKSAKIVIFA